MPNRLSNLGYMAIGKEATKGTAVTPTVYVPYYDDTMNTNPNIDKDNPIVGQKSQNFDAYRGMRNHGGTIKILAEPNTMAHMMNMFSTQGSPTVGPPSTFPFTFSNTTDPKSYTIDLLKGQTVHRYYGCEIYEVDIAFEKNKMVLILKVAALGSFMGREVASVSGTGPTTITLKTNYDPSPTTGLVASDLLRAQAANGGTVTDTTITSVTATTIVVPANLSSLVAGDLVFLRGGTPSYTLRQPFLWAKTEFRFGATAAAALSAAQTRAEVGSKWLLVHEFENNGGSERSGSFDPAVLNRKQARAEIDVKLFFDTIDDWNRFITASKRALVIRHFSEDSTYEARITLNNLRAADAPIPQKSDEILYQPFKFFTTYDQSDAQAIDIKIINALSSV